MGNLWLRRSVRSLDIPPLAFSFSIGLLSSFYATPLTSHTHIVE